MARNSYLGVARLATHPAFQWPGCLVCPICGSKTTRVAEYDRDFLAHNPDARQAWRWLSWKTYERHAPKRGWPSADEALAQFGDDTV